MEFIEWLVSYAEGFEWREDEIRLPNYCIINVQLVPKHSDWRYLYYPLLLQKAKIGWNKICNSGDRILEIAGNTSERYLKYGKYQNIIDLSQTEDDQALEEALKYTWEQEKK